MNCSCDDIFKTFYEIWQYFLQIPQKKADLFGVYAGMWFRSNKMNVEFYSRQHVQRCTEKVRAKTADQDDWWLTSAIRGSLLAPATSIAWDNCIVCNIPVYTCMYQYQLLRASGSEKSISLKQVPFLVSTVAIVWSFFDLFCMQKANWIKLVQHL